MTHHPEILTAHNPPRYETMADMAAEFARRVEDERLRLAAERGRLRRDARRTQPVDDAYERDIGYIIEALDFAASYAPENADEFARIHAALAARRK